MTSPVRKIKVLRVKYTPAMRTALKDDMLVGTAEWAKRMLGELRMPPAVVRISSVDDASSNMFEKATSAIEAPADVEWTIDQRQELIEVKYNKNSSRDFLVQLLKEYIYIVDKLKKEATAQSAAARRAAENVFGIPELRGLILGARRQMMASEVMAKAIDAALEQRKYSIDYTDDFSMSSEPAAELLEELKASKATSGSVKTEVHYGSFYGGEGSGRYRSAEALVAGSPDEVDIGFQETVDAIKLSDQDQREWFATHFPEYIDMLRDQERWSDTKGLLVFKGEEDEEDDEDDSYNAPLDEAGTLVIDIKWTTQAQKSKAEQYLQVYLTRFEKFT